jgi:hypothetical protein
MQGEKGEEGRVRGGENGRRVVGRVGWEVGEVGEVLQLCGEGEGGGRKIQRCATNGGSRSWILG